MLKRFLKFFFLNKFSFPPEKETSVVLYKNFLKKSKQ